VCRPAGGEPIAHRASSPPSATALGDETLDGLARHAEAATRQPHSGTAGS